jgi:O-antigen/teichoic acid export membrane protein
MVSININRSDVIWNYLATFLKLASSTLLLPLILRKMPSEMVGIWSIFISITAFSSLIDFGFSPSFTRNVTYIFSGVSNLRINGIETVLKQNIEVDYGLLKGLLDAMRWLYLRMALGIFIILSTIGTIYISTVLHKYKGDISEIYLAWGLLCAITSYNIYTLYYDALLMGKGMVKISKQIVIFGNIIYLILSAVLLLLGYGIVAIILAQGCSVILIRWLSKRAFFTLSIKINLSIAKAYPKNLILKVISPNAFKIGLTTLGGVVAQRSSIIIGSLYLTLSDVASYAITTQLIAVLANLSVIYTYTYQPKISQLRIENNNYAIKNLYLKGISFFCFYS